jgi:hypothetical protein
VRVLAQETPSGDARVAVRLRHAFRWLAYWGPPLAWSVGLYVASAQPALPPPGETMGISDDLVNYATHALSYGVLA